MDAQLIETLTDFGALGIASGAIFWLYVKANSRLDVLTTSFQEQLKALQQDSIDRENSIRDRYDVVVAKYDEERLKTVTDMAAKLDLILAELRDIEARVNRDG